MAKHTKREQIHTLIQHFITVRLEDGTEHSGYIGNAKDFGNEEIPEKIVLVNGLLTDVVSAKDIVQISFPKREETTEIPIIGNINNKNIHL